MTNQSTPDREAFEKWAAQEGYGGLDDMLSPLDRSLKATMWKVWQAAQESRQVQEPVAYLVQYYEETKGGTKRNVTQASLEPHEPWDIDPAIERRELIKATPLVPATPISGSTAPVAESEKLRLYDELLYAVERKFPGESRHQTALRYIYERESIASDSGELPKNSS